MLLPIESVVSIFSERAIANTPSPPMPVFEMFRSRKFLRRLAMAMAPFGPISLLPEFALSIPMSRYFRSGRFNAMNSVSLAFNFY